MARRGPVEGARLLTAIRPAATVVLVRDSPHGLVTYALVRSPDLVFVPGATVFPGGAVDPEDHGVDWVEDSVGYDAQLADAHLETTNALSYWVAAARECYEEVGVLLGGPDRVDRGLTFHDHIQAGRVPVMRDMWYFGHWVTPAGAPRRYDTRFFMAVVGDNVDPDPDRGELISGRWLRPHQALDEFAAGHIDLIDPTERTLRALAAMPDTGALRRAFARSARRAAPMIPQGRAGARVRFAHEHD